MHGLTLFGSIAVLVEYLLSVFIGRREDARMAAESDPLRYP
jgi:hypothetical protein